MHHCSKVKIALSVAGILTAGSAFAADDPFEAIYNSCKAELKLSDSGCECVVNAAQSLNENELTFFVAAISGDPSQLGAAQSAVTGAEMMNVTNFMTVTPTQCQNQ